jgi:hypothetical protein
MRLTSIISVLSTAMLLQACGGDDGDGGGGGGLSFSPTTAQTVQAGATKEYTISGLNDAVAYRVTLVVGANITVSGTTATFLDNDDNGAADAGASENIALITALNGEAITGVKTFPGGMDDPAAPTGIFPEGGEIVVEITGLAAGTVVPVAYPNAGATTFLEVGADGAPVENYGVGGALTVSGSAGQPVVIPNVNQTLAVDSTVDYTIYGLNDTLNYRITLVVAANVTVTLTKGVFVDAAGDGAADAGASENIALITSANGEAVADGGAKTIPSPMDDPAAPTGVRPSGGKITVTITGKAAGEVYPVAYVNGGASTLLELGAGGAPSEVYSIGGKITVQ